MTYPSCNRESVTEVEIEAKCLISHVFGLSHQIQDCKSDKTQELGC